jgi:hypothetical protein
MRLAHNRRRSNVGGGWRVCTIHLSRSGYSVLKGTSRNTLSGVMVQMPGHRWLFFWRRDVLRGEEGA